MVNSFGRKCSSCKESLPWEAFNINSKGLNGRKSICRKCTQEKAVLLDLKRKKENPLERQRKRREKNLKYTYGLSEEDYLEMLGEQDNRCGICRKSHSPRLFVDHCHTTGEVRGLLCQHCNSLLGFSKDNKETLSRAAKYLDSHEKRSRSKKRNL